MVISSTAIAASISRPPLDPLLRRESFAGAPTVTGPSTAARPEVVPGSASYPGAYINSTSEPHQIYRRQSTLNSFPTLPSRFESDLPSRRTQSMSGPSGGLRPGSSMTTSATSAQVYARLYETLVEKWAERARSIAASSPRDQADQRLPSVESENSPTRKRRQEEEDIVDSDSTVEASSSAKKARLEEEEENLDAIKEGEEEMIMGGASGQPKAEVQERPCSAPPLLPSPMTRSKTKLANSAAPDDALRRSISPLGKSHKLAPRRAASPLVLCRRIIASRRDSATGVKSTRHQPVVEGPRHCTSTIPCRSEALLGVLKSFELVLQTRAQGWRLLAVEGDKIELRRGGP
ncbi:BZ3500_MvSof-1268-A1-R1_Chr10-2g02946 [Microbotryum saponariae]|uniref:BZ3500_MvSof-1268-A1-R1_Chr10-2g02946 protein n=1 Tax=Microbotryum saponariae TaxID=289078 RepID=A0A2X0LYT9_9BASI|nr:BZ3501_MvSof-1269-A2-R1_Chr10-2g02532 [Microbotryum saponariae]SDA01795.1 BZ3500_MvSof-1268-A1-R1_Chr10-2g02946 [Microbotryum saponariae]